PRGDGTGADPGAHARDRHLPALPARSHRAHRRPAAVPPREGGSDPLRDAAGEAGRPGRPPGNGESMIGPGFSAADWKAIAPFSVVMVFAMGILLYEAFFGDPEDAETPLWFSILGVAGGLLATLIFWDPDSDSFRGTFTLDGIALFANVVCGATAALT